MEVEIFAAGVDSAASVHDRQVVQRVESSPVVAACADNVAVIGQDRPRVGTEEPSCQQRFLALIFDWQRGRISLSHEVEEIPPELAGRRSTRVLVW